MKEFRKTVVVRNKDQAGWYVIRDRVPIEDKEELQNPDDIDVALIFAAPPRYYRRDSTYWRGNECGILGIKPWCRIGSGEFGYGYRGLYL